MTAAVTFNGMMAHTEYANRLNADLQLYYDDVHDSSDHVDLRAKIRQAGVTVWNEDGITWDGVRGNAPAAGVYPDCVVFLAQLSNRHDEFEWTVRLDGDGEAAASAFEELMAPVWKHMHEYALKEAVMRAVITSSDDEILQIVNTALVERVHRS